MNIRGIYKTSLIDYPGKISTVLFTGGCNLRCKYCHNPDLVVNSESLPLYSEEEVLDHLRKRRQLIDGISVTGGEPTLRPGLLPFLQRVRDTGLLIKVDTNGLRPDVIKKLINEEVVDFFAIDIKTSPEKYEELTGRPVNFSLIKETLDSLKKSNLEYEVRTTCVPGYSSPEDLKLIMENIGPVKKYCLQQFIGTGPLLDTDFNRINPLHVMDIHYLKEIVSNFADEVVLRGV